MLKTFNLESWRRQFETVERWTRMKTTLILVFVLCQISQLTISLEVEFESSNKTSLQCDLDLLEDEHAESSGRVKRAGLVQSWWQSLLKSRRWPRSDSGVVIVPYIIQENSHYSKFNYFKLNNKMLKIYFSFQLKVNFTKSNIPWRPSKTFLAFVLSDDHLRMISSTFIQETDASRLQVASNLINIKLH